jgi:hypothetical protein
MVSMVIDYVRDRTTFKQWDWDKYWKLQKILDRLEELGKKLGEPECKDDRKAEYMEELRTYLGTTPTVTTSSDTRPSTTFSVDWDQLAKFGAVSYTEDATPTKED